MDIRVNQSKAIEETVQKKAAPAVKSSSQNKDILSWGTGKDDVDMQNDLGSMSISSMQYTTKSKQPTVSSLKNFYNSGHSAEETYEYFKDTLQDLAKNDKDGFKKFVSQMLKFEGSKYDYDIPHKPIADNQAEILEKFLTSKGDVDNAICTTIHGFMMDTLHELGIKSSLALGEEGGGHATLIYQLEDGKYVFNDYGKSKEVQADNVMEALRKVNKSTDFQTKGGYSIIHGDGSDYYEEYSFKDEAAYGDEIDSKSKNKNTAFTNKNISSKTGINASSQSDKAGNQQKVDVKGTYVNDNNDFRLSFGLQHKKTKQSDNFNRSSSIGAKAEAEKQVDLKNGELTFDAGLILNNVTGTGDTKTRSFQLLKESAGVTHKSNIFSSDDTNVTNAARVSEETSAVASGKFSAITDTRFTLEDGVKVEKEVSDNLTFRALVNAGVIAENAKSDYAYQNFKLNLAAKGNAGVGVDYKLANDTTLSFSGTGFVSGNENYKNYGADAEVSLRKKLDNSTASAVEFGLGYSVNRTNIHVGGFNENVKDEQKITERALFDLGDKLNVYSNYNYEVKDRKTDFSLGFKYNID